MLCQLATTALHPSPRHVGTRKWIDDVRNERGESTVNAYPRALLRATLLATPLAPYQ